MNLKYFLEQKMRMSHIYQPVMIKTLLRNGGKAHQLEIAQAILLYDQSQLEYYERITNNMVGRVLRSHNIVKKQQKHYQLLGYDDLSQAEIDELITICNEKIQGYLDARGEKVFAHRRKNHRPVPGSIRYKVLKRARFRCELCGVPADEKALEVDHITPKNLGGEDSINNYQALCYTCNANKRDTDDTDLRGIPDTYTYRKKGCVFCANKTRVELENNLAYTIRDKYPVTPGHTLIIPKRHCLDYFDLSQSEINAIHQLIEQSRQELKHGDPTIMGFNIGINNGTIAGQSIMHCHIHFIPRREGDVRNPLGGVRNVIPGKGDYLG